MERNSDALCEAWLEAKRREETAHNQRTAIEEELAEAFEVPDEGSKTTNGENYKVTMTQPISRKLDLKAWEEVKGNIPKSLQPIKTKIEADATGCKYLAANEPESWAKIAKAFTSKPGKIAVKVEAK